MDGRRLHSAARSAAKKAHATGHRALVPVILDPTAESQKIVVKSLSLQALKFLHYYRSTGWDIEQSRLKSGVTREETERLVKKLQVFREEDEKIRTLAHIPTADWVNAKHVENVYNGGEDNKSTQKSLEELAKIGGFYKTQPQLSLTQNVFNLPKLTPEIEAKFKELADQALDAEVAS